MRKPALRAEGDVFLEVGHPVTGSGGLEAGPWTGGREGTRRGHQLLSVCPSLLPSGKCPSPRHVAQRAVPQEGFCQLTNRGMTQVGPNRMLLRGLIWHGFLWVLASGQHQAAWRGLVSL